jgi:hypothetical protein
VWKTAGVPRWGGSRSSVLPGAGPRRSRQSRRIRDSMASASTRGAAGRVRAWLKRIGAGPLARCVAGLARRHGRHDRRSRRGIGPRIRGLLAVTVAATALAGVLTGCTRVDHNLAQDRVLWHGEQFAVGTFEPQAAQAHSAGTLREGTLVVDRGGCLALQPSSAGHGVRVLAVPVGSYISEHGTVYVVKSAPGEAGGPVMAGNVGDQVRFTGPEIILGWSEGQGVAMPASCAEDGTGVLLVVP